ncbi:MAG TPA: TonB-dependent receptor [Bacteroidota bacterium]|nr:TonB-dependent receptor [Bacteroidota bacterium]
MKPVPLLSLFLSFTIGVIAQVPPGAARVPSSPDSTKTYPMNEVVVSATRSERAPGEIGRSVSVIPKEMIAGSIYNSVAEVLSQRQGVYVVGNGQNPGMLQSLFMRGAASNQTSVLIDEVPITDPSTPTHALDLSELALLGTDRIELVRGSHSTLYGSSAIGGVVNVLSAKEGLQGFNSDVEFTGGTFGANTSTFGENILLNYTAASGIYANAGIAADNVKGLDATVDTLTTPGAFKNRDRDDYNRRDILGKIGYKSDPLELYASYRNTTGSAGLDKGAFTDDNNDILGFRRNLFTYGGEENLGSGWSLKLIGGYSDLHRASVDDSSVVDATGTTDHAYSSDTWKGSTNTDELQANFSGRGLAAVVGGGVSTETMGLQSFYYSSAFGGYESTSNLDTLDIHTSIRDLFLHVDANGLLLDEALSALSLGAGIRFNRHSTYGDNTTLEINPSYSVRQGALLYFSYSTGFNAPSLYELYAPDVNDLSGIARGNRNLTPETSSSYEAGFKQSLNAVSYSVDYFVTVTDNLIEDVYLWDKNIGIDTLGNDYLRDDFRGDTYLNVGKQTTNGFEASFHALLSRDFSLTGNLSIVAGRLDYATSAINLQQTHGNHVQLFSNGQFVTGNVEVRGLARRPNSANLSLAWIVAPSVTLTFSGRYAGRRNDVYYDAALGPYGALGTLPIAAYTLFDLAGRWDLGEHVTLLGRLANLFDTRYSEIAGYTTEGRGIYVSLRYEGQPF